MKYFDYPTQVTFIDDEGDLCRGIAYKDYITCDCCGAVFELDEVRPNGAILPWIDLDEAIRGE